MQPMSAAEIRGRFQRFFEERGHTRVPSPRAPNLIAVDKHAGEVVWRAIGPGGQVLHGQWSSPVAADSVAMPVIAAISTIWTVGLTGSPNR